MKDVIRRMTISGMVQGVGYRAWFAHIAVAQGLEGWVRNRRDGSVEGVLAGREAVVAEMIARCRRGPSAARVDEVIAEEATADMLNLRYEGEQFSILSTL
jgi:acylphosphatase